LARGTWPLNGYKADAVLPTLDEATEWLVEKRFAYIRTKSSLENTASSCLIIFLSV
jgi:hypothetical protein